MSKPVIAYLDIPYGMIWDCAKVLHGWQWVGGDSHRIENSRRQVAGVLNLAIESGVVRAPVVAGAVVASTLPAGTIVGGWMILEAKEQDDGSTELLLSDPDRAVSEYWVPVALVQSMIDHGMPVTAADGGQL